MANHQFIIDLNESEKLSVLVGQAQVSANTQHWDEFSCESWYDEKAIYKYELLREKQLKMMEDLIKKYGNK